MGNRPKIQREPVPNLAQAQGFGREASLVIL
jgi:hypothetical protein